MLLFRFSTAAAAAVLSFWPALAYAGVVTVQVDGVRGVRGEVFVALCSAQSFNAERCEVAAKVPAGQSGAITFPGVPPGTYAVKAFHDDNSNGRLDTDWFGSPTEGYGLSNNPPRSSWKRFDAAAFTVGDQPVRITVQLSYR